MAESHQTAVPDAIFELQTIQRAAECIDDSTKRQEYTIAACQERDLDGSIQTFSGQELLVRTDLLVMQHPDAPPNTCKAIRSDLTFGGRIASWGYFNNPSIPMDSLAISFVEPILMQAADDTTRDYFRKATLRIPVLSIISCVEFAL